MIENIIEKNIAFLQRHILCDENDVEIFKYSLRILYSYIIDVIALMSLAIITDNVLGTIVMLAVFAILQVYGGGYHANTKLGCFIIMVVGWFIGIFGLIPVVSMNSIVNIVIMMVSTVLIFILTPVMNEKHPVGSDVYIRSRKIVRITVLGIDTLTILFMLQNWGLILTPISTVMTLYSVSLVAAVCKQKGEYNGNA